MAEKLKIIPLGGLNEIGKNITVLEYGKDMIVVDCGVGFPEEDMYGVDLVIPDFTYLVKNQGKLRGFFITHGHEDHIGSLPYALQQVLAPVHVTPMTGGLIRLKLEEHGLADKVKLVTHQPGDVGSVVLRDRKHLAQDGMLVVCVNLSSQDGSILSGPDIITRGFVYVKESENLMEELRLIAVESLDRCRRKGVRDWATIKSSIKNDLSGYLFKTTKRNPMILPVIMEI